MKKIYLTIALIHCFSNVFAQETQYEDYYPFPYDSVFFEPLNADIHKAISGAVEHTKSTDRKTVMGRDFNFYIDKPEINEILVVASKVKAHVKSTSGLSTSKQVMEQLTVRIQKIIEESPSPVITEKVRAEITKGDV